MKLKKLISRLNTCDKKNEIFTLLLKLFIFDFIDKIYSYFINLQIQLKCSIQGSTIGFKNNNYSYF